MDLGLPLAGLFLFLLICFIIFGLYVSAVRASEQSQNYREQIPGLRESFGKTRSQLQALKPYYHSPGRAYLYTDIDTRIRAAIEKAEEEIKTGSHKEIKIYQIDTPEASLRDIFDVRGNRQKLATHVQNKKEYQELNDYLTEATRQIANIHAAIQEERNINDDIEKKLKGYLEKFTRREAQLDKARAKLGDREYSRLHTSNTVLLDQIEHTLKSLPITAQEDNINYARAAVFRIGLEQLFELYQLDYDALKIPFPYELDISREQIASTAARIKEKISGIGALAFTHLHLKATELENEIQNTKNAAEIFEKFKTDHSVYESRRREVCGIKLDHLIQLAHEAERDWEIYWGSLNEAPKSWESLLQKTDLPSVRLRHISELVKKICASEFLHIKQSDLSKTIAGLDFLLKDFGDIQKYIDAIREAVEEHQRAEAQTIQKIGNYGSSTIAYENIFSLKDMEKCSPKTEEKIKILEEEYLDLCNRAKVRKKADYPEILKKLSAFEASARVVKAEHDKEIRETRAKIEKHSKQIATLKSQFLALSTRFPTEDRSWEQFTKRFDEIQQEYLNTGDSFQKMTSYEKSVQDVIKGLADEKHKIDSTISRFAKQSEDLKTRVRAEKKQSLDKAQMALNTTWSMPLKHKLDALKDLLEKYDELYNKLDTITTGALAHVPRNLTASREELLGINGEISDQIGLIIDHEQTLNEALNVLGNALDREIENGLSSSRQGEVAQLIEQAKGASSVKVAFDILSREAMEKLGKPSIEVDYKKTNIIGEVRTNTVGDLNKGKERRSNQN